MVVSRRRWKLGVACQGISGCRGLAAVVLLAITVLLVVPDPHDHGDASSLGGLFRLLLPGSTPVQAPETGAKPHSEPQGFCPIHFWQQVVSTILLITLLLRFFLCSTLRGPASAALPAPADRGAVHSRAPPILP